MTDEETIRVALRGGIPHAFDCCCAGCEDKGMAIDALDRMVARITTQAEQIAELEEALRPFEAE